MPPKGFRGLTVAAFESRMTEEMTRLITRYSGQPLVAPSMQEIPLENNTQALEFGDRLIAGHMDMLILLTGVGTRTLVNVWKTRFSLESITKALSQTTLVARGPKPIAALRELGLTPQLAVPEPNTWHDVLNTLDSHRPEGLGSLNIGVQEYGVSNQDLLKGLTARGANVTRVPVYRWALPQDVSPLRNVLASIIADKVDVCLITNAAQVDHIFQVLDQDHQALPFRKAMKRIMIASIGQIASECLRSHDLPVDYEPSHSKMGILVKESSEQASDILDRKRLTK